MGFPMGPMGPVPKCTGLVTPRAYHVTTWQAMDSVEDELKSKINGLCLLLDLGLWNDCIMEHVEVLSSNLSKRRFGLSISRQLR
ncbi:hypothetical protein N7451_012924 [Penicillium sp. IBT 35674x]|nr:hypothetical protein N7451_012924 [Penicillium sp. IBT 35674x]